MAMRHARLTVFTGAMLALGLMHVMSAFFGYATTVIPRVYTYYISSFLFAVNIKYVNISLKYLKKKYFFVYPVWLAIFTIFHSSIYSS